MASVATSLALGQGFGSPYWEPTGPTAIVPPVYPAILAGLYRVFGVHAPAAGQAALTLNVLFSSATCIAIWGIGRELFDRRVGLLASLLWAVYPLTGFSDVLYVWNTSLYVLLLTSFFWAVLRIRAESGAAAWTGLGLLSGLTVLTEPAALAAVLPALAWLWWMRKPPVRKGLLVLLVMAVPIAGWTVRNYRVFDRPVFLRSGFGSQLSLGLTGEDLVTTHAPASLPGRNPVETRRYAEEGEIEYMRRRQSEALDWIESHPEAYARTVARRAIAFWTGSGDVVARYWFYGRFEVLKRLLFALPAILALPGLLCLRRKRPEEAILLSAVLILYPVVYYLTVSYLRFRLPLEPLLIVLSGCTLALLADVARPGTSHSRSSSPARSPGR